MCVDTHIDTDTGTDTNTITDTDTDADAALQADTRMLPQMDRHRYARKDRRDTQR